jgi:hypothetical protein
MKIDRSRLIQQLMDFSDDVPPWKWMKLWKTYSELSTNRLLEIRSGFRLAERGLNKRGICHE